MKLFIEVASKSSIINDKQIQFSKKLQDCHRLLIFAPPDDFEEMEALLMEQERLVDNLEKERQEKEELERIKTEQEKDQVAMQDTIKTLEEEIVTVSQTLILVTISDP